ncbi:hypothetical protein BU15DRAFT_67620 [Melanogaster broomeanus]|nr:hypothetical protein BU15DRAFT_67620 [Melanogaster broomeanus]
MLGAQQAGCGMFTQDFMVLKEHCNVLDAQLSKVTVERDTIKQNTMNGQTQQKHMADPHWKTAFLEDVNSVVVSKDTVKAIWKAICTSWIELADKGIALKLWSKLCASS